jgi:hypothetical protein
VVLHSANRTAYWYLAHAHLEAGAPKVATSAPDDFYVLYLNSTNAEWWGANPRGPSSAVQKRVFDTIEWVISQRQIDRNRVYLTGVSMGGCGTLGIGMPRGEVFAAIRVTVPAGTEYAASRMGGWPPEPAEGASPAERDAWVKSLSGFGLPDPPVVVDFSATNDNWSKTQPALVEAALAGHLPLVLSWGAFGHTAEDPPIAKLPLCDVALAFPWWEIRRNEAYPVFTRASCDQHSPWRTLEVDPSGQVNAYFRWQNQSDTRTAFAMDLWLAHPAVANPPATMPDAATADVTLRRLQKFSVQPGATYAWELKRDGNVVASGRITPDAANLLTVPRLPLTTAPSELSVTPVKR